MVSYRSNLCKEQKQMKLKATKGNSMLSSVKATIDQKYNDHAEKKKYNDHNFAFTKNNVKS